MLVDKLFLLLLKTNKMDLIEKLAKGLPFTDEDIKIELHEICDRNLRSCNTDCPVFKRNGNKVPAKPDNFFTWHWLSTNFPVCDCFKSGSKMLEFLRNH